LHSSFYIFCSDTGYLSSSLCTPLFIFSVVILDTWVAVFALLFLYFRVVILDTWVAVFALLFLYFRVVILDTWVAVFALLFYIFCSDTGYLSSSLCTPLFIFSCDFCLFYNAALWEIFMYLWKWWKCYNLKSKKYWIFSNVAVESQILKCSHDFKVYSESCPRTT
jgi:hypothetical protein